MRGYSCHFGERSVGKGAKGPDLSAGTASRTAWVLPVWDSCDAHHISPRKLGRDGRGRGRVCGEQMGATDAVLTSYDIDRQ